MEFRIDQHRDTLPSDLTTQVDTLLEVSFPPEERRDFEEFHRLLGSTQMELLTAVEEGQVQGVLIVWNLENLVFLENFAVSPTLRGHGLGSRMLDYVWEHWKKPMLLEVEPPEGTLERRRIGFYHRNGFYLNSTYPYRMPCLHGDGPSVPLLLMSRPQALTDTEAKEAARQLYRTVYTGKNCPEIF